MSNNEEKLKFLLEISSSVSSVFNFDALLRIVIEKLLIIMNCSRCSVVLLDEKNEPFIKLGKGFNSPDFVENEKIEKAGSVTQKILKEKVSVIDNERKFLSVPVINNDNVIGIINVTERNNNVEFTSEEADLLYILSTQIGYAIESIKLHKNIVKMEKLKREMEFAESLAHKIVKKLEPCEKLDIFSFYRSAFDVGGDYFERIEIYPDNHLIFIGDVSGKGLYASIIVIMIHSLIKAMTYHSKLKFDIVTFVETLNNMLYEEIGNETTFSTMFVMHVDTVNKKIDYVNCGHNFPLFISDGKMTELKTGGVFLGCFDGYEFSKDSITYKENDFLLLYSDGIVEYREDIKDFIEAQENFKKTVYENFNKPFDIILNNIFEQYYNFEKKPIYDDASLIFLRF
ncbi:MAG: GAF domain-containing SpoIIE family protein phosphatase [Candidatus Muiribacteriota bacterium]